MVAQHKAAHRKTGSELVASSNLGSDARIFDNGEVLQLLRRAIELEGSQLAFAKRHGVDRTHLIYVLQGKRQITDKFLKLLGLRKVYTMVQE